MADNTETQKLKLSKLQREISSLQEKRAVDYDARIELLTDDRNECMKALLGELGTSKIRIENYSYSVSEVGKIDLGAVKKNYPSLYSRIVEEHVKSLSISKTDFEKVLKAEGMDSEKVSKIVDGTTVDIKTRCFVRETA